MNKRISFSFTLDKEQQTRLITFLKEGNYPLVEVPYTIIATKMKEYSVNLYTSGKCLIQGKGAEDFVLFVMEPNILQSATLGYEALLHPETVAPHMGSDESGKGDFFGPLVTCAVYVDPELAKGLADLGVVDCKKLTDRSIFAMAPKMRALLGNDGYAIVQIGPEAYNRLYAKMRNVNSILAWAHARCIENLLTTKPDCPLAVADQFGAKSFIEKALMKNGKKIKLDQHHKAESDIAVAAASVFARELFLRQLKKRTEEYGIEFFKGVSEQVCQSAVALVQKYGPEILVKTAKCHFQTIDKILGSCNLTREQLGPLGAFKSRPYSSHHKPDKGAPTE